MDAAQKMGLDNDFASVPPPQAYWLAKRLSSVDSIVPSTWQSSAEIGVDETVEGALAARGGE